MRLGSLLAALAPGALGESNVRTRGAIESGVGDGWSSRWGDPRAWYDSVMDEAHRDGYVVNFGAHFNVRAARTSFFDPTSAAMRKPGARGLAVDADDAMPWAAASVSKRTTFLKPGDMAGMLDAVGVPPEPRLFKIDIDSFDVAVALAVLDARSPEFVTCEVQEVVPPPACYCNDVYRDGWERLDGDAYGCSLVGYANAFATRNYSLVALALNNALFVRDDRAGEVTPDLPGRRLPTVAEAYDAGYASRAGELTRLFKYNAKKRAFVDGALPYAVRVAAMAAYPPIAKGLAARQATFVGDASPAWPCAPRPGARDPPPRVANVTAFFEAIAADVDHRGKAYKERMDAAIYGARGRQSGPHPFFLLETDAPPPRPPAPRRPAAAPGGGAPAAGRRKRTTGNQRAYFKSNN